ncbi:MAG: glycosyltransferase family 2 protein [Verrucomicrobiaceae bacterium]
MQPGWQYPEFSKEEFAPKRQRYALCVFMINEGSRIQTQLQKMKPLANTVDIILADGGSTDGSLSPELLKSCNVRMLLTKCGPGKLSAQMRMALAFAMEENYEGVVLVDGNDKDDTSAMPAFVAALDDGFDHIQGSRYIPGGKAINTPFLRHWGVMLLHSPLISLAAGFRYTDTTNGFRAYSRRFLLDEHVQPFRDVFQRYELHYYLAIRAARLGFKVKEVPVTRAYPAGAPAPTKISPFKGNLLVLQTLFRACLGKYNPTHVPSEL